MTASKTSSPARTAITVLMDLLVLLAVVLIAHLVVTFFGALSGAEWGKGVLGLTKLVVVPFGIESVKTPYGGTFDIDAAITVLALLAGEWVLGLVRRSA